MFRPRFLESLFIVGESLKVHGYRDHLYELQSILKGGAVFLAHTQRHTWCIKHFERFSAKLPRRQVRKMLREDSDSISHLQAQYLLHRSQKLNHVLIHFFSKILKLLPKRCLSRKQKQSERWRSLVKSMAIEFA